MFPTPHVTVCIPTFRRPQSLARLLMALACLDGGPRVRVLVADNDADRHEGAALCQDLKESYRFALDAVIVRERGIAQVRNALIAEALDRGAPDFIAMIDDDEWPDPQWLNAFLHVQEQTGADVVQGSILFEGARLAGDWAEGADGFADIRNPTGPIAMVQGAGNIFLRAERLRAMTPPWFDPSFALTGGEDRDFFTRMDHEGARFAWSDEAVARGEVAATRINMRWALRRAYSIGNTDMRVLLKYGVRKGEMLREAARIVGALTLSPLMLLLFGAVPRRRAHYLRKLARAAGKISALFGLRYDQYAVVHGK